MAKSDRILDFSVIHHMTFVSQHFLSNIFTFDILYIIIADDSRIRLDGC